MRAASVLKTAVSVVMLASCVALAGCDEQTPNTPTETPTTTTITFASNLAQGGASTRSFAVTRAGTVSATLTHVANGITVKVGLGVGIPLGDGSGCVLSRSVETVGGNTAQLELSVDTGSYCLQIYDLGTLTSVVPFSITLVYPSGT
jgi:hypothetical protein